MNINSIRQGTGNFTLIKIANTTPFYLYGLNFHKDTRDETHRRQKNKYRKNLTLLYEKGYFSGVKPYSSLHTDQNILVKESVVKTFLGKCSLLHYETSVKAHPVAESIFFVIRQKYLRQKLLKKIFQKRV
jgi:hypothetical protein